MHAVKTLCALATLLAGATTVAAPSSQLTVTGTVTSPATYDFAALQALPATTQTVTFSAGGSAQTHTYTGTGLWNLLDRSGLMLNPNIKNDVLDHYVVATGSDGYRSIFSLGELSPMFGNRGNLVAYAETINNVSAPLGADGFARVTAPGDVKGGRYVSNLVSFDVERSASQKGSIGGGTSTSFSLGGAVANGTTFDLAALEAMPATTLTVGANTYTGVSFDALLNSAGILLNPTVKNDVLNKYVVATGTDGYQSLFALGELDPGFGNQPDLIAYSVNGASLGDNGFARIVVPNDIKAGRWVSNLASIEVFSITAVPEPASLALMLLGLAIVVRAARRR